MNGLIDRELGETDARLGALETRMTVLEAQNAEMLKALYMGRGIVWAGGLIAAATGVVLTVVEIYRSIRGV